MFWLYTQLFVIPTAFSVLSTIFDGEFDTSNHVTTINVPQTHTYTELERNALQQFRKLVNHTLDKDYERTDAFLIPWIRSSEFNLATASRRLQEAKEWKRTNRIDTILDEEVVNFANRSFCIVDGLDNDGNPIVLLSSGGVDVRKWVLMGKGDDMLRSTIKCLEETVAKIRHLANTTGKDITQSVAIIDFSGYNLKQHACIGCVRLYLSFFRIIENYYPELPKHLVVINVPTIAKPVTEIAKGIMSKNTAKVLKVFGADKIEWSSYLLKIIPADQLPSYYGGTRDLINTKISSK